MLCPNCGNALDEDARRCGSCGGRVDEALSRAERKGRSLTAHFVSDIAVAAASLAVVIAAVARWFVANFPL